MGKKKEMNGEELLHFSDEVRNPPFNFFDTKYPKDTSPTPKKPAPKKSRAKGFFVVFSKIIAVLMIVGIVGVSAYIVVAGAHQQYQEDGFVIEIGNFGSNPVWMPDASSTEINDIYNSLNEAGELQTVYEMYELACKRLNLSQKYAIRAIGTITTVANDGLATVVVNSNRVENYEVLGQPSLNANQPRVFSNMDINYPLSSKGDDLLVTIIQGFSVESIRAYYDGDNVYEQRTKKMKQTEDGEIEIQWPTKYEVLEGDFERSYEDHELREKANFVINPNTIVPDSVEIEMVEDNDVKRYDIYFQLDCEDIGPGSATYYEAEAIKRKMGQSQTFEFTYMDVSFSIYENGYMTHWTTNQNYRIAQDLGIMNFVIDAHNYKKEAISYDTEDCEVINFLELQQENEQEDNVEN